VQTSLEANHHIRFTLQGAHSCIIRYTSQDFVWLGSTHVRLACQAMTLRAMLVALYACSKITQLELFPAVWVRAMTAALELRLPSTDQCHGDGVLRDQGK